MKVSNLEQRNCCGCTACMNICTKHAIEMHENNKGFLYPLINNHKCIDCGLCVQVCNYAKNRSGSTLKVYAAKNTNKAVLKRSSSGGVSHALAKNIIEHDGVVYGVVYDVKHEVITERLGTIDECEKLYGSKYVQTNPCNTFSEVLTDLKANRPVLYFGTSCHISGLLSFLELKKCPVENLITVDLICHGVPSPLLFRDYINFLKSNKKFRKFEFRTKKHPWGFGSKNYGCTIYYDDKEETDSQKSKLYLKLFFSNNCLRKNCHSCKFIGENKPADITIADYWGLIDEHPDFYSELGVSAVIVHTQKGDDFINNSDELILISSSIDKVSKKQGNMHSPSPYSKDEDEFWKLYESKGFMAVANKYGDYALKTRIKKTLQGLIRR